MVVQDAQLEDALGRTILGGAMIYDGVFDATLGLFVIVRALKKMPIFGKTNENAVSFYTCEQFSDIQIPSLF